jgi:UDP-N-acetylmuramate dehydrogenase
MTKTIDFTKYSSIKIGAKHKIKIIDEIGTYDQYTIIGGANNLLISNKPKKLAMLSNQFDYILQKDGKLIVGGATSSSTLLRYCRKYNIANFELLAKLPGLMGGLVKMNAGLKQWEITDHLISIKTATGVILKEDLDISYRHTNINQIVYETVFDIQSGFDKEQLKLFNQMRQNQPKLPSAGSCFKNPKEHSAGYLLESVGLRGYNIGGMAFSSQHANFLVNLGSGTFDEAIKLITIAKQRVLDKYNIRLSEEIIILD